LWEVATGKEVRSLPSQEQLVTGVAFSPDGRVLVSASKDRTFCLWEVASGREIRRVEGHRGSLSALVVSRDGRFVITGSSDGTALVWSLPELLNGGPVPAGPLAPAELERAWSDLLAADAAQGQRGIWALVGASRQAVPLLRRHLKATAPVNEERVRRLLADLDHDDFAVREKATAELETLREQAGPALRRVLDGRPSPEVRKRAEQLLERWQRSAPPPEQLREQRAVAVLERIGTSEARRVLSELAKGGPEARLTQEAKASLARLSKRTATSP
jgi:hypothetical protein